MTEHWEIPRPTTDIGQRIFDETVKAAGGYFGIPVADFCGHMVAVIADIAAEAITDQALTNKPNREKQQ